MRVHFARPLATRHEGLERRSAFFFMQLARFSLASFCSCPRHPYTLHFLRYTFPFPFRLLLAYFLSHPVETASACHHFEQALFMAEEGDLLRQDEEQTEKKSQPLSNGEL